MSGRNPQLAADTCLQCDTSRAAVRAEELSCGIVDSYSREVEWEWDRHRWASWSDRELDRMGVLPHAYERYRRSSSAAFMYLPCDDSKSGHSPCRVDDAEWGLVRGQCLLCGARDIPIPADAELVSA